MIFSASRNITYSQLWSRVAVAVIIYGMVCVPFAADATTTNQTGCNDILNTSGGSADYYSPSAAPGIECPSPPCQPNACTYDTSSQTYSNCGPLTKCILQGEDPPLSSPQWDEPPQGFSGMGSTISSGKCGPVPTPNSASSSSTIAQTIVNANCPVAVTSNVINAVQNLSSSSNTSLCGSLGSSFPGNLTGFTSQLTTLVSQAAQSGTAGNININIRFQNDLSSLNLTSVFENLITLYATQIATQVMSAALGDALTQLTSLLSGNGFSATAFGNQFKNQMSKLWTNTEIMIRQGFGRPFGCSNASAAR